MLTGGEPARAAGWLARSRRRSADGPQCAALGYLRWPAAGGSIRRRHRRAGRRGGTVALGERCGDTDLVAFARCVQGRALIRAGRPSRAWRCSTR